METTWQDEVFEAWWEDTDFGDSDIEEIARLAFHRGWDAGEDR